MTEAVPTRDAVPPRKRRPAGQARQLLLEAARRCFESQGYGNTSTRAIADDAQVSEGLLFRYFGTKKQLFHEAMVEPLASLIAQYVEEFDPHLPAQGFQEGLFQLLDEHRQLLLALLTAEEFESEVIDRSPGGPLAPVLEGLESILAADVDIYGFENIDVQMTARLCFATTLGLTFFDRWLFGDVDRPARSEVIKSMLMQIVHGLAHRPPPPAGPSPVVGMARP